MHIRKGDLVQVLTGKDKGKQGKVLEIDREKNRARVDKVMTVKRHVKRGRNPSMPEGGIIEKFGTIHVSNLALVDPKSGKPSRIGHRMDGDKKVRFAKKSGTTIEAPKV